MGSYEWYSSGLDWQNKKQRLVGILLKFGITFKEGFLVNDQRDAQILFYVFISIYNSLHVSSTSCSSSGETINTASGNSHSMLVAEMCAGWKNIAHISAINIE